MNKDVICLTRMNSVELGQPPLLYLVSISVKLSTGSPRGFGGPGAKLQNQAPCVCDRSEQNGQKASESGGTESGSTLRTL